MKVLRKILFCFACLAMFLVAAALSCAIRAKYRAIPRYRSNIALSYLGLVGDYSFLQYNQAGGEAGRAALMEYLDVLRKIENEKIPFSQNMLHGFRGLTYLRLYRLAHAENKPDEETNDLLSAQKEFLSSGFKGVASPEDWAKSIATREAWEAKHYNNVDVVPVAADGERKSFGPTR
jgi:hypothetical protein